MVRHHKKGRIVLFEDVNRVPGAFIDASYVLRMEIIHTEGKSLCP